VSNDAEVSNMVHCFGIPWGVRSEKLEVKSEKSPTSVLTIHF
jgi:hypothetical protein